MGWSDSRGCCSPKIQDSQTRHDVTLLRRRWSYLWDQPESSFWQVLVRISSDCSCSILKNTICPTTCLLGTNHSFLVNFPLPCCKGLSEAELQWTILLLFFYILYIRPVHKNLFLEFPKMPGSLIKISNITPSLSSGNHLFYKAEYMGRSCPNQIWAITFDWSALATWNKHFWTAFWKLFSGIPHLPGLGDVPAARCRHLAPEFSGARCSVSGDMKCGQVGYPWIGLWKCSSEMLISGC